MSVAQASGWHDVRWEVLSDARDLIHEGGSLLVEQWARSGRLQVVKEGSHRAVYRIDLAERTFFLKHDRAASFWRALRHLFRPHAALREARKAIELLRRHVPTIRPVAIGERSRGGVVHDSFLVTEAIPGALSLHEFVNQRLASLPMRERSLARLARRFGELCAAAHQAGVYHNDLHGGNVLVQADAEDRDAELKLYLVDLPGVQLSGPVNWRRSCANLVMLNFDWASHVSERVRWRFWRAYCRARTDMRIDRRARARDVVERTRDYACRLMLGRDKRAFQTNRDFYRLATKDMVGHAVADVLEEESKLWLQGRAGQGRLHIAERDEVGAKYLWRMAHALLQRGIGTPRPLAVALPRGLRGWLGKGRIAFEPLAGAFTLRAYLGQLKQRPADEQVRCRKRLTEALGQLIGRMHGWRISHRELTDENLLVRAHAGEVSASVLKMAAVRIGRRLSYRERVYNLALLARCLRQVSGVTRTDCLRFLRAYLRHLQSGDLNWKRLWHDVAHCFV
jgi:tRNA A-37 threonylcarbamoyl transferase component Bud32